MKKMATKKETWFDGLKHAESIYNKYPLAAESLLKTIMLYRSLEFKFGVLDYINYYKEVLSV